MPTRQADVVLQQRECTISRLADQISCPHARCQYEMAVPRFSGRESCWASWAQLDTCYNFGAGVLLDKRRHELPRVMQTQLEQDVDRT